MIINKTQTNEKIVFALDGRLDTTTAPQLQEVLIPAFDETKRVELDFASVVYVSSAGLRVLLLGEKTAKTKNAEMVLSGVSTDVKEVFEMTGFTGVLKMI